MTKRLETWLDEFIENGANPNNITEWPAEGVPTLQEKTVDAQTSNVVVTPDTNYDGLSQVTVSAVTNTIDSNIVAENIKKDVTILGVTGTYEIPTETVEVTPTTLNQVVEPSIGKLFSQVTVNAVTNTIDSNIIAENIKKDVTILGVTGTLESGGGGNNIAGKIVDGTAEDISAEDLSGATSIRQYAFYYGSLTSIEIPNSVTSIGKNAFNNCSSLTSVTVGNSVTSIGLSAFWGCSSLTSITIPDSVTSIGQDAFKNCSNLTSVTIGNSLTRIGTSVFYNCSSLTSVTIGNSVTNIGFQSFAECSSITSIEIPNNVTKIELYAFQNCTSLTDFNYAGTMAEWSNVTLYDDWNANSPFTVVHCSDGDVTL